MNPNGCAAPPTPDPRPTGAVRFALERGLASAERDRADAQARMASALAQVEQATRALRIADQSADELRTALASTPPYIPTTQEA